jgi:hypothetical protein
LPVALTRSFPAPYQHRGFVVAADERRQIALPGTAAAAARPHQLEMGSSPPGSTNDFKYLSLYDASSSRFWGAFGE